VVRVAGRGDFSVPITFLCGTGDFRGVAASKKDRFHPGQRFRLTRHCGAKGLQTLAQRNQFARGLVWDENGALWVVARALLAFPPLHPIRFTETVSLPAAPSP
jgi:hypothetical protein